MNCKGTPSKEKRKNVIYRLASVLSPNRLVLMIQRTQDLKSKKNLIKSSNRDYIHNFSPASSFSTPPEAPLVRNFYLKNSPLSAHAVAILVVATDNPNSSVSFLHHQRRHLSWIISQRKPRWFGLDCHLQFPATKLRDPWQGLPFLNHLCSLFINTWRKPPWCTSWDSHSCSPRHRLQSQPGCFFPTPPEAPLVLWVWDTVILDCFLSSLKVSECEIRRLRFLLFLHHNVSLGGRLCG